MSTNADRDSDDRFIDVETPWQGTIGVRPRHLTLTHPEPVYLYRQHGRTIASREPMLCVEFDWNEGHELGVARERDLIAAILPSLNRGAAALVRRRWCDDA